MTRNTLCAVALISMVCAGGRAWASGEHRLAGEGIAAYRIVVDNDAIPAERTAARELKLHLDAVTRADFEVVELAPDARPVGKCLFVGGGERFAQAVPGARELGYDGICVVSLGEDVYLGGDRPRGTLYAVYEFLEVAVGCRWWTPSETHIPDRPELVVPAQDIAHTPPFRMRETFSLHTFDPVFSVRNRINGHYQNIPEEYGGHHTILGWCHTFFPILSPEEYFEKHPEWFSVHNGERVDNAQLCLTNEDLKEEFIRRTLEWLRENPDASAVSISQNDNRKYCQCPECMALAEHEDSQAGPVIHFVNDVAEAVEAEFPDMMISTLAYTYSQKAPRHVKPRHNIAICLCSYDCDFSEPLATGARNAEFLSDIREWSKRSSQIYVWNYVTNFSEFLMPHPNWDGLGPDLRLFEKHKAFGVFEQGDRSSTCGDFYAMRPWVLAKMMWDTSRDPEALIREFLDGYYGPAGAYLWEYIQVTRRAIRESDVFLGCYMHTTRDWLTLDDMNQITALYEKAAESVAGDPILERRLETARMPVDYVWVRRYDELAATAEREGVAFSGPADPVAFRDAFIRRLVEHDTPENGEGRPIEYALNGLRRLFEEPGPLPTAELEGLDPDQYVYRSAVNALITEGTKSAALVRDPLAHGGWAVRIPGHVSGQVVRFPVDPVMQAFNPEESYILLRADTRAGTGIVCETAVYDPLRQRPVVTVRAEDLDPDGYVAVKLPRERMRLERHIAVEMPETPGVANAVYVAGWFCKPP